MNQTALHTHLHESSRIETGRIALSMDAFFWVDLNHGRIRAKKSFGCLVAPTPGDQVLVALTPSGPHYILQVLEREGNQPAELLFDRQTRICAPGNHLTLNADRVSLVGKHFELGFHHAVFRVKKWLAHIDLRVERLTDSYRWVRNLERTVAGRFIGLAKSTLFWKGKQTRIIAEEKAVVDGKKIQIG